MHLAQLIEQFPKRGNRTDFAWYFSSFFMVPSNFKTIRLKIRENPPQTYKNSHTSEGNTLGIIHGLRIKASMSENDRNKRRTKTKWITFVHKVSSLKTPAVQGRLCNRAQKENHMFVRLLPLVVLPPSPLLLPFATLCC